MFDGHGVNASVKSAALGGTSACFWAAGDNGTAIVNHAKKLFPDAADGPDYLWYTAGADDVWQSPGFQLCERTAKDWEGVLNCFRKLIVRVAECSAKLLKVFLQAFPKAKVMQSGYDVPCYSAACRLTWDGLFALSYCRRNITCSNQGMYDFIDMYSTEMRKQMSGSQYTMLFMMGAVQKANGVPGADVGKPVLNVGANCAWETLCVHPKYNSAAGDAWGRGFWDLYFSKHVNVSRTQAQSSNEDADIVV